MVSTGGPVKGDDFFNREKEVKEVLKLLEKGNVLLVAPRRYGKTSLMKRVEEKLSQEGYFCLLLDVMYIDNPVEFVIELADAAFNETSQKGDFIHALADIVAKNFEFVGEISLPERLEFRDILKAEINEDNWTEKGKVVLEAIASAHDKKPVYLIIDELSECICNMIDSNGDTTKFLQWLRTVRMTMDDLRFLVGGSVNFDRAVRLIGGSSWINDFERAHISGFSRENAIKFIETGLTKEGLDCEEKIIEKILECVGEPYIPYFIAVLVNMIIEQAAGNTISESLVKETYVTKVLGVQGKGYFDYYQRRLKLYYPEVFARAAEEILIEATFSEEGYSKDLAFALFKRTTGINDYERFMNLLYDLQNDFYITLDDKNIRFQSKILREWWRVYYG